jgi:hypothetical protein
MDMPATVPEPQVEFVRDWFFPWYARWSRAMYGGRGVWFASGCLLLFVVLPFIAVKAVIFWSVAGVVFSVFFLTATCDALSYHWRKKRAAAIES